MAGPTKRILIVGGGFGGVYAALELEPRLAGDPDVAVTIVNRDNFFLFTPMLREVAASDPDLTPIVNPVRKLLPRCGSRSTGRSISCFSKDLVKFHTARADTMSEAPQRSVA